MLSLNLWHEGVLAPIDTNSPVGTNVRLDDAFDLLRQEVSNDLAMDREATDWNKVLTLSSEILTQQSKDLLVLVYSIRSIIDIYKYEGLARSVALLPLYIDLYWENSFPLLKRKRARLGVLEWLTQHLELWIEGNEPFVDETIHLEGVIAGIKALNNKLVEYGSEWPLDSFTILRKLDTYLQNLKKNDPVSSGAAPSSIAVEEVRSPEISHPQKIASPAKSNNSLLEVDDEKSYQSGIRCVQGNLKLLAKYRLSKDISDPLAYKINRFSTWLPILELPQHKEKVTPLRPIPLEKRQVFEMLHQQKQYESLIKEVESSLSASPFWLDGHRIVFESLQTIDSSAGKPCQKAMDSVSDQVKAFITRVEGIERLSFSDGSPFADTDTLEWLAGLGACDSPVSDVILQTPDIVFKPKPENTENNSTYDEQTVFTEAHNLLRDKRFSEGLSKLDTYCKCIIRRTNWFQARMLMAKYCISAKEYLIAEQLLAELDEISMKHQLDSWEPETVTELLSMMLICTNKLKRKDKSKIYFNRLSRLDVMQAYEIKKGE